MEFDRKKLFPVLMLASIILIIIIFNISYFFNYISANNQYITDYDLTDEDINPVRDTAIAGLFYPADTYQLDKDLNGYLEHVSSDFESRPQIMIVPHAGYRYSAQVAAHAYKKLEPFKDKINKVFLLGPSHQVMIKGAALSPDKAFRTPLGLVKVNKEISDQLAATQTFVYSKQAHLNEHSLEVQLPFLQKTLSDFSIIPIVYGDASPKDLAAELLPYIQDDSILIVSADLSHYLDYQTAVATDLQTADKISQAQEINHHLSCGATAINTASIIAKHYGFVPKLLNMINSGDVSEDKSRVVGYGAWVYEKSAPQPQPQGLELEVLHLQNFARHHKQSLLKIVKQSILTAIEQGKRYHPKREDFDNALFNKGASFVTIKKNGRLRGCIGSVIPNQSVAHSLSDNAFSAALNDKRFSRLTSEELKNIDFTISLLTNFEPIIFDSYSDLLSKIEPKTDGLIIEDGERQGVFLPSVWQQIPNKDDFITELKIKAGISPTYWSQKIKIYRFRTVEITNDNS